jgi:hypothetical protein
MLSTKYVVELVHLKHGQLHSLDSLDVSARASRLFQTSLPVDQVTASDRAILELSTIDSTSHPSSTQLLVASHGPP